jgi:ribosomal protein L30/L7E
MPQWKDIAGVTYGSHLLSVGYDPGSMDRLKAYLVQRYPQALWRTLAFAVNKTLGTLRSRASRSIRDVAQGLRLKDVRKSVFIKRRAKATAGGGDLSGAVLLLARRVPAFRMGAQQTAAGVTYRGPGGAAVELPHAFIQRMPESGHRGVFFRTRPQRVMERGRYAGKLREPITEEYGGTIAEIFEEAPGVLAGTLKEGGELLAHYTKQEIGLLESKRMEKAAAA